MLLQRYLDESSAQRHPDSELSHGSSIKNFTDLRFKNQWKGIAQVIEDVGNPRTSGDLNRRSIEPALFYFGSSPRFLSLSLTPI